MDLNKWDKLNLGYKDRAFAGGEYLGIGLEKDCLKRVKLIEMLIKISIDREFRKRNWRCLKGE